MPPRSPVNAARAARLALPLLVVIGLTLSALGPSNAVALGSGASAPTAPGTSTGVALGSALVEEARASLLTHASPVATARPAAGSGNWSLVNVSNASATPSARQLESLVYDPVDGYVVLFGGGNVNPVGQNNDTWTFSNGTWTHLPLALGPSTRRSASITWDAVDGYVLLFGGVNPDTFFGGQFQDSWSFLHGVWTNRTAATINASNTPSIRWNAQMAYDPGRRSTILFGGCYQLACTSSTNDTWSYVAGNWTNITSTVGHAPSVRGTAGIVWYPPDESLLLYGGSTPNQTVLGDTWELNPYGWTQLFPAASPPALGDQWMIYDNLTANVVLFGGLRYSVSPAAYAIGDTWTYANATWTNQTLNNTVAPSDRWGLQHAGAYDAAHGCGYLFGGADSNDNNLGDFWQYGCPSSGNSSGGGGSGGGSGGGGGGGSGGGGGNFAPQLLLVASPSNGTAPLNFNVSAQLTSSNLTGPYLLRLEADPSGASPAGWNRTLANWDGQLAIFSGLLTSVATYIIVGTVDSNVSGTWSPIAWGNATIVVGPTPSSAPPPSLSFSVTPGSGSAPLNVSIIATASGGASPYNLSVCLVGPSVAPNASGPCAPVGGTSGWNGSALTLVAGLNASGNYTVTGIAVDSDGGTATASAAVVVANASALAPLIVHASLSEPLTLVAGGATYGFATEVSGGLAPYSVQWSFGDGALGSAIPGSTVRHTYTVSGTYTATLTVTDALGHRASSQVGPLSVSLGAGVSGQGWATTGALVAGTLLGILAVGVIAWTTGRLVRRREALKWLRTLERARARDVPGPKRK